MLWCLSSAMLVLVTGGAWLVFRQFLTAWACNSRSIERMNMMRLDKYVEQRLQPWKHWYYFLLLKLFPCLKRCWKLSLWMLCIKGLSAVSAFHHFTPKMVLNRVFESVRLNVVRHHMIKRFMAGTNVTFHLTTPSYAHNIMSASSYTKTLEVIIHDYNG